MWSSAAIFEEFTEQFGSFGFEDSPFDGDGVVEAAICRDVVEGSGVAGFGIGGGVDEALQARGVGGAGAHGAWFEGRVEGTAGEPPAAQSRGGPANGE